MHVGTYVHTSSTFRVNEVAEFSFTVGEDGKFSGSGTGNSTESYDGDCAGEFSSNDVSLRVYGEYDKSMEYGSQFNIRVRNNANNDQRHWTTKCFYGEGILTSTLDRWAQPFSSSLTLYLKPEDGATSEGVLYPKYTQSNATIEIHRAG